MGSRTRKGGYNHVLAALQEAISRNKGGGKGRPADNSQRKSWNCKTCGKYNFEFRSKCIECGEAPTPVHGKAQGKENGGKGGSGGKVNSDNESSDIKELRNKLRQVEAENKSLRSKKPDNDDEGRAEGEECGNDLDNDGGDDANGDGSRINELQKSVDLLTSQIGADDLAVIGLRKRLDAARAKQRAGKPLWAQITAAERRSERISKQLETAHKTKEEYEKEKVEAVRQIDAKIAKESVRIDELTSESEKLRAELMRLHDRAKQQKEPTAGETHLSTGANQRTEKDVWKAWESIKAEAMARATGLGADPKWSPMVDNAFAQLQAVFAVLPKEATTQGEASNAEEKPNDNSQGSNATQSGSQTCPNADNGGTEGGVTNAQGAMPMQQTRGEKIDVDMVQEAIQEQIELVMADVGGTDVDQSDEGMGRRERAAKLAAKIHGGVLQRINKPKPTITKTK